MTGRAPGKLILSGEHAVVYGQPALVTTINRYARTIIESEDNSNNTDARLTHNPANNYNFSEITSPTESAGSTGSLLPTSILFTLPDIQYHSTLSITALEQLSELINARYCAFQSGEIAINSVIETPEQLLQYAAYQLLSRVKQPLPKILSIYTNSTIPIGSGLGSSAASIVSVLRAMADYFNLSLSKQALFELALPIENLQHGRSGGQDLRIIIEGGCGYYENNQLFPRAAMTLPIALINTGKPASSTGECVSYAAHYFQDKGLVQAFAAATRALDSALSQNDLAAAQAAVRENHRLLIKIGVVPKAIQVLISQLEAAGVAAKVCGAGSIRGDHAGAVAIFGDKKLIQPIISSAELMSDVINPASFRERDA